MAMLLVGTTAKSHKPVIQTDSRVDSLNVLKRTSIFTFFHFNLSKNV